MSATRLHRTVLVALATVAAALGLAGPAAAADWQEHDTDSDGYVDATSRDLDDNGLAEDVWFDIDRDGEWDTHVFNTKGSEALLEVALFDMDENDEPEIRLRDGDQGVGFDYVSMDRDQNGYWDRLRRNAIELIIPGSRLDWNTRTTQHMATKAIMDDFYRRTGESALFPTPKLIL